MNCECEECRDVVWCGCGDSIERGDGGKCGTCVWAIESRAEAAEQRGAERERARIVALVRERAAIWAPHFQTRARMLLDDLADELERK